MLPIQESETVRRISCVAFIDPATQEKFEATAHKPSFNYVEKLRRSEPVGIVMSDGKSMEVDLIERVHTHSGVEIFYVVNLANEEKPAQIQFRYMAYTCKWQIVLNTE